MINVGAYVKKSNPKIDLAIEKFDQISIFLRQKYDSLIERENAFNELNMIMK